jgi:hypothetical protein
MPDGEFFFCKIPRSETYYIQVLLMGISYPVKVCTIGNLQCCSMEIWKKKKGAPLTIMVFGATV